MEKDFEELKTLFQQKKPSAAFSQKVVDQKVKDDISGLKINHLKTIITFIITPIALVYIDSLNAEKMDTSASGFWILIGCSLYYALSKTYLLYRLSKIRPIESVLETVKKLERYKKLNIWMHTYGEVLYVLILGFGVYLYLRPVLDKFLLDKTGRTILCFWWVWGICILWMFFYTFVIKRRRMKKDVAILEKYMQYIKSEI
ncbi:hypothetical protein [Flavobacterium gelatinilyticum]|uniref:hypothetical protein n=1 Tax=Flavobacterium gelatinilyticum TaxID=3003260 RepID=UPI00247FC01A|nr:hypothetical protein [Flavobacterium gelatinilyticum]